MIHCYLRQYRFALLFALLTWFSCAVVLLLSALPVTPVIYGLGLGGAAGLVMLVLGYFPYARRLKLLREMDLMDSLEHLPSPRGPLEQQYQALLRQLFEAKAAAVSAQQQRYEETLDYFTLWAHQIKTPISAMDLILQSRPDAGEMKGELFKVQQYVSMALNYLRMGEGISDFVIRECQLDDILRTAVHTYPGQGAPSIRPGRDHCAYRRKMAGICGRTAAVQCPEICPWRNRDHFHGGSRPAGDC